MIDVFYLDTNPNMPSKQFICVNHTKFHCKATVGSYQLLGARLFGISWANYLRLCRDEYGAEIYGRNTAYPVAYFDKNSKVNELVRKLNELANIVLEERGKE